MRISHWLSYTRLIKYVLTFLAKKDILYIPLYHYEGKSCYYDKVEHLEALPRPYRPGYLRFLGKEPSRKSFGKMACIIIAEAIFRQVLFLYPLMTVAMKVAVLALRHCNPSKNIR